ncbi:hypothetical protein ACFL6I_04505 [candidate division KSB1 bacterium]
MRRFKYWIHEYPTALPFPSVSKKTDASPVDTSLYQETLFHLGFHTLYRHLTIAFYLLLIEGVNYRAIPDVSGKIDGMLPANKT